ncbi:MAG: insulinase family protein [Bacteroidales bacterium]|nr:insulinase family protein [Bacteroidales bacterium]
MKKIAFFLTLGVLFGFFSCTTEKYRTETKTDSNGYSYETVTNDPLDTRVYTLENGLKVYLSVNKDQPRIQTLIPIRAGSASDPVETTGLAHYFEHLMFKGTQKIATTNWEEESKLIQQISDLFEQHKSTQDPAQKLIIYRQIDSLSQLSAQYVATNEYDKLVSSLGAKGTNAGTSYDMTVYINDIPSNELEKWLRLESERFGEVVLRLFHTELETVYEEYNMYNDMDDSRASNALMEGLFSTHPYGRDVIGLPEHLKNPSMVNIYKFYHTFYVPNNMAIILTGDLNPDRTIQLVDQYFGSKKPAELPAITQPVEEPITQPVVKEVSGPDAESVNLAFRFGEYNSTDRKYVTLLDQILSNSQAGLIDLDLNQQQKVLRAESYAQFLNDYGIHLFYGNPRQGQTLEEVKDLLLGEIEKVKKGEFDDWMLEAVINDFRLNEIRREESNASRAFTLVSGFINGTDRKTQLSFIDEMEKITKAELIKFVNEHYKDNYVVVYKRLGEKDAVEKVEKPPITPVPVNRDLQSDFAKEFSEIPSEDFKPVFLDFEKEISKESFQEGVEYYYMKNPTNELFNLNYIIDMGKNHDRNLPIAVNYLPYLGTDKYSPADLQKEFFRYGLRMGVSAGNERSYVYISGLQKSFDKGVELLEHVLSSAKADPAAYTEYVKGILKERADRKLNNSTILWGAMFNYGKYGPVSPFTDILTEEQLNAINPDALTDLIKGIYAYKHKIFYYGQEEMGKVKEMLSTHHKIAESLKEYPQPVVYQELETKQSQVYFVDYDMTQVNLLLVSKDQLFDRSLYPPARLFGEYFGSGLSSIVFQEIREARGLAYSAMASYALADKPERSNFSYAFVGTQADKLMEATNTMLGLMNNMPRAEIQFNMAKESIIKQLNSERIIKAQIFWTYMSNLDKGINYDIRKEIYDNVQTMTIDDLNAFFDQHIKGKAYTYLVLGKKGDVRLDLLEKIGPVKELTLEEIFNY